MKKLLSFAVLSLMLVVLISGNCNKNDPPPPTKTELISRSPWIFQSAFAGTTDISNTPPLACFKDNIITFSASGTFNVNESTNVCSPSTAGNFTWNFQNNETELVLSSPLFPGGSGTFTLVSLTETNLVVSQVVNLPPPTTVTVTFKH